MTKPKRVVDRVLLGLVFMVAALWGLVVGGGGPDNAAAAAFIEALEGAGLFHVIKTIEFISGLALVTGRYVPLALCLLAPVLLCIVFFHATLELSGLPFALVLAGLWAAVASAHREAFSALLQAKPTPS